MSLRKRSLYGSYLSNICLASGEQKIVDANELAESPRMWSEWVWDRRWRAGTTVSPGEAPNWSTRIGKGGMKPWRGVPRGIDGPPKLMTGVQERHCGPKSDQSCGEHGAVGPDTLIFMQCSTLYIVASTVATYEFA
jgi:hypothetical protein